MIYSNEPSPLWNSSGILNKHLIKENSDDMEKLINDIMRYLYELLRDIKFDNLYFHGIMGVPSSRKDYDFIFYCTFGNRTIECWDLTQSFNISEQDIEDAFEAISDVFWSTGCYSRNRMYEISIIDNNNDDFQYSINSYSKATRSSIIRKMWKKENKIK